MKPFLDESVVDEIVFCFGRKCFWMKVFLDELFFAIWMKVYLTLQKICFCHFFGIISRFKTIVLRTRDKSSIKW